MSTVHKGDWRRVTRSERCPICERPDWCLVTGPINSPAAAICARIESRKRTGEAGWLHRLADDPNWRPTRRRYLCIMPPASDSATAIDFDAMARGMTREMTAEHAEALAASLGLAVASLAMLSVGHSSRYGAYSFPMRDELGRVTGIRLRRLDGSKWSVKGSKQGLFMPSIDWLSLATRGELLLICEGASDCASLLELGLMAIGRPSCRGSEHQLAALVKRLKPEAIAIIADRDEVGLRGASYAAEMIAPFVPSLRMATAPAKDVRAWKLAGATATDVHELIARTPRFRFGLNLKGTKGSHS